MLGVFREQQRDRVSVFLWQEVHTEQQAAQGQERPCGEEPGGVLQSLFHKK